MARRDMVPDFISTAGTFVLRRLTMSLKLSLVRLDSVGRQYVVVRGSAIGFADWPHRALAA